MSAARKFSEQCQEAFSSMPLSSRITTGLLAILVLIGFGFVVKGDQREDSEMLFGGRSLSEQELIGVEMSFSQVGLNDWRREGRRISVPAENRNEYLSALSNASSLPVSIRSSVQDAIEKTTFLESSSQRLAREMHAKEQDLGNKLTAFPEIRWASVEYDRGEREGLGRDRQQTVSVLVCPEAGRALSPRRIEDIQKFIGGSYAGMRAEDVFVVDTHETEIEEPSEIEFTARSRQDTPQLREQERLAKQVTELLKDYGPVRVSAYVELNRRHQDGRSSDQTIIPQPTIANQQATSERATRESGQNQNPTAPDLITHVRSNRATRLHKPVASGGGENLPANPQHLASPSDRGIPPTDGKFVSACVSIGLPQSYYQRLWSHLSKQQTGPASDRVAPPPTSAQREQLRQQTQDNIRAAVTPALLSLAPYQSQQSMVQIYEFPDLLNTDVAASDTLTIATTWLWVHWQQVALLLVCFFGLTMALRLLGKSPVTAAVNRPLASQVFPQTNAQNLDATLAAPDQATDASTDRELLTLIEEDPDAAVDVIRGWIGEAA